MLAPEMNHDAPPNPPADPAASEASQPRRGDPLLIAYLAERNVPCPRCRYNLRGATAGECPECSLPIRLMISGGALTPGRAWWFGVAIVLIGVASGCFALYHVRNIYFGIVRDFWRYDIAGTIYQAIYTVIWSVAAAAAVITLRQGRRWTAGRADAQTVERWAMLWLMVVAIAMALSAARMLFMLTLNTVLP